MPQYDRDPTRPATPEPGPQPDPMLTEERAGAGRKWAVTAVIVVVLLTVMYGITAHRVGNDQQRQTQAQTSQPNTTSSGQALPGGRTTADAPSTPAPKTSTGAPKQ
jgi:hypothetical protein